MARAPVIEKNRAAMVDLMEDMVRGIRWFEDPANRDAAIADIAAFSHQPREKLDPWLLTKRDQYHDLNGLPDVEAIKRMVIDTLAIAYRIHIRHWYVRRFASLQRQRMDEIADAGRVSDVASEPVALAS